MAAAPPTDPYDEFFKTLLRGVPPIAVQNLLTNGFKDRPDTKVANPSGVLGQLIVRAVAEGEPRAAGWLAWYNGRVAAPAPPGSRPAEKKCQCSSCEHAPTVHANWRVIPNGAGEGTVWKRIAELEVQGDPFCLSSAEALKLDEDFAAKRREGTAPSAAPHEPAAAAAAAAATAGKSDMNEVLIRGFNKCMATEASKAASAAAGKAVVVTTKQWLASFAPLPPSYYPLFSSALRLDEGQLCLPALQSLRQALALNAEGSYTPALTAAAALSPEQRASSAGPVVLFLADAAPLPRLLERVSALCALYEARECLSTLTARATALTRAATAVCDSELLPRVLGIVLHACNHLNSDSKALGNKHAVSLASLNDVLRDCKDVKGKKRLLEDLAELLQGRGLGDIGLDAAHAQAPGALPPADVLLHDTLMCINLKELSEGGAGFVAEAAAAKAALAAAAAEVAAAEAEGAAEAGAPPGYAADRAAFVAGTRALLSALEAPVAAAAAAAAAAKAAGARVVKYLPLHEVDPVLEQHKGWQPEARVLDLTRAFVETFVVAVAHLRDEGRHAAVKGGGGAAAAGH